MPLLMATLRGQQTDISGQVAELVCTVITSEAATGSAGTGAGTGAGAGAGAGTDAREGVVGKVREQGQQVEAGNSKAEEAATRECELRKAQFMSLVAILQGDVSGSSQYLQGEVRRGVPVAKVAARWQRHQRQLRHHENVFVGRTGGPGPPQ